MLFRRTLAIGQASWRGAALVLALATVPLGSAVSATAEVAALALVLGTALTFERRAVS